MGIQTQPSEGYPDTMIRTSGNTTPDLPAREPFGTHEGKVIGTTRPPSGHPRGRPCVLPRLPPSTLLDSQVPSRNELPISSEDFYPIVSRSDASSPRIGLLGIICGRRYNPSGEAVSALTACLSVYPPEEGRQALRPGVSTGVVGAGRGACAAVPAF